MSGVDEDASSSPSNRLKFLCSYGGKILPRPTDGMLKYVGGETRVISVPRSITFPELKEKISGMFNNADIVMKYQVTPEDLDVLVSVRSDQDLHYLLEEYDRREILPRSPSSSSPRFRVFLFPSSAMPATPRSPSYVTAINTASIPIPAVNRPLFTISAMSANSSPTSTIDFSTGGATRSGGPTMQRVRSTPNLSESSSGQPANSNLTGSTPANQQKSRMMACSHREACGYGCGCSSVSGQQQQSQRRYYYSPSFGGYGGYRPGHAEVSYNRSRSGNSSFQFGAGPPTGPSRRSIWE